MKISAPFTNPLCVALDVDDKKQAISLAESLSDFVGGLKVGPRLVNKYGESLIRDLSSIAPVFVDCKFFDIESTMLAAVKAVFEAGASVCTVHALAGMDCLRALSKLEKDLCQTRPFRILAVTILTSWSEKSYPAIIQNEPIEKLVRKLAEQVQDSGLNSIVCSAQELVLLKDLSLYKLTPGIRFDLDDAGDQKRIATPDFAIKNGANALVVGRPIIAAQFPREKALDFTTAIYSVTGQQR